MLRLCTFQYVISYCSFFLTRHQIVFSRRSGNTSHSVMGLGHVSILPRIIINSHRLDHIELMTEVGISPEDRGVHLAVTVGSSIPDQDRTRQKRIASNIAAYSHTAAYGIKPFERCGMPQ